jgi:hypothetical protein
MAPRFLLPESVARQDGAGAEIALETDCGKSLLLTLGIDLTVEQESLEISVWGSPDQRAWKLLQAFPQKFYCGTYSLPLDLTRHPDVRFLRAQWRMSRWGAGETTPMFGFYLAAQQSKVHAAGVA